MTKERRDEVLLVALVVSVAIHIGLMFFVRSQVMTRAGVAKTVRREPMRVTNRAPRPSPAKIEEIMDLKAVKDAPPARDMAGTPLPSADNMKTPVAEKKVEPPRIEAEAPSAPAEIAVTKFETRPPSAVPRPPTPMTRIETPRMKEAPAAPEFSVLIPSAAKEITAPSLAPLTAPAPTGAGRLGIERGAETVNFTPASAVYEKVDAAVVAEEKAAVRSLVNASAAADLQKFVNLTMTSSESDGWRYFKVMMTPRTSLAVVPKDVVLVIDGSGSIGKDRFSGCRRVAQKIMRSCMNSNDRFNLVVFRNAFSYAFQSWQDCTAESFAAGDRWLNRQTAHGRTDVFSTISSVLTLPRDPKRPLVALVVTDGDANSGVSDTADILSQFTSLNDGLVSVYMYGVKSSANRELIDVLTHGNRGESFIFEGWRWNAGEGLEELSARFRDPVLSDLRLIFAADSKAEAYPLLLKNLYRGETLSFVGRVPANTKELSFSLRGLNGPEAYEGFFRLPFATAPSDPSIASAWAEEKGIAAKLK